MQFIASNTGGQGKPYQLKKPSWAMPPKLRAELTEARHGRTCYADSMTRHELVGESCGATSPSTGEGGMSCDDMWALTVAAEWHIESQGVWLCGQGHPPVNITEDSCPTPGCSVQKTHLAEICARYWLNVASAKGEVVALSAKSYDNASAASHFAKIFSTSRCGSHHVGWIVNNSSDPCTDCNFSSMGGTDNDDDPDGSLVIMEEDEADSVPADDHPHDDEVEEGHDQAERVAGGKPIWRDNIFAKSKYIPFRDLAEKALAEGMPSYLAGSKLRTFNIRDACWIFLLNKARSEGTEGEIANLLPPFCSTVPEDTLSARLQYCTTEASKKYPPGAAESERHPSTLLIDPPNTHFKSVKRKDSGDGQCGAPPAKVPRFSMTPNDFVKCMGSYLTANLSNSSESKNPMQLAEKILTRYYAKGTGSKDPQTSCSKQAEAPTAVEHPQPDLENNPEPELERIPEPPSSMSEDLTGGPSPNKTGSSYQKGKEYKASSHKSILSKDSLPKSSYKDQKSNRGRKSSYEYSSRSFVCGTYISPGVYCEQLREPRHTYCMACEKRTGCKPYNTRYGGRGGPRGGPPRGGFHGGYRGSRGGRQGGRGFGRGRGIPA